MGRTSTTWRKGQSGNPAGKRPNMLGRDALRKALGEPAEPGSETTKMERWAQEIVRQAVTLDAKLAVLKFLEGSSPPHSDADASGGWEDIQAVRALVAEIRGTDDANALFGPRIRIPGAFGDK